MSVSKGAVVALFLLSALVARSAKASSIRCWGEMRLPDCRIVTADDYDWPPSSQPSFTAQCQGCPSPNDAGYTCMSIPPWIGGFVLTAGSQSYRNSAPGERDQKTYFEEAGPSCEGRPLYRYKGPLQAGTAHVIDLGGHDYPKAPITFYVATAETAAPLTPRGADLTLPESGQPGSGSGWSCSVAEPTRPARSAAVTLAIAALMLAGLARRRSRR